MTDIIDNLSDKQRLFVEQYFLSGLNASEAARRCGYKAPRQEGARLLSNAAIRAAIDARLAESAMSAGEVLHRLTEIARGSLADMMTINPDGTIAYDFRKLDAAGKLGLVKEIGYSQRGQMIVKLHDPIAALDKLGRYHRLFDRPSGVNADGDALNALRDLLCAPSAEPSEPSA